LYAEAERLAFLNATAPQFFWHLQRLLHFDMLLTIARMLDEPDTAGNKHLSIRRLPGCCRLT
jgi:hypothetical protein